MISKILRMQMLDDDELAYSATDSENQADQKPVDGRPAWMKTLSNSLYNWIRLVPKVCMCYSIVCMSTTARV